MNIDPTEYPQKTLAQIWMHERAPGPPTIDHDPRAFHRSGSWPPQRRLHVDRWLLAAAILITAAWWVFP